MKTRTISKLLFSIAFLGLATAVSAESWTTTGNSNSGDDPLLAFTGSSGTSVTVNGFRADMFNSGQPYDSPFVTAWTSGLGVRRHSGDEHTVGNNANDFDWSDGILLDFDSVLVNVTDIQLASNRNWGNGASDKDFGLWACVTAACASGGVPSEAYSTWSIASNGWVQAASVDGGQDNSYGTDVDSYSTTNSHNSNLWIVLAANADTQQDAFKIQGFSATTACLPGTPCASGQVPVPATLALLAIGALVGRRRMLRGGVARG